MYSRLSVYREQNKRRQFAAIIFLFHMAEVWRSKKVHFGRNIRTINCQCTRNWSILSKINPVPEEHRRKSGAVLLTKIWNGFFIFYLFSINENSFFFVTGRKQIGMVFSTHSSKFRVSWPSSTGLTWLSELVFCNHSCGKHGCRHQMVFFSSSKPEDENCFWENFWNLTDLSCGCHLFYTCWCEVVAVASVI